MCSYLPYSINLSRNSISAAHSKRVSIMPEQAGKSLTIKSLCEGVVIEFFHQEENTPCISGNTKRCPSNPSAQFKSCQRVCPYLFVDENMDGYKVTYRKNIPLQHNEEHTYKASALLTGCIRSIIHLSENGYVKISANSLSDIFKLDAVIVMAHSRFFNSPIVSIGGESVDLTYANLPDYATRQLIKYLSRLNKYSHASAIGENVHPDCYQQHQREVGEILGSLGDIIDLNRRSRGC